MDITVEQTLEDVAIIRLKGRLDLVSGADVRQRLAETIDGGRRHIVIDLAEVPFIDSSGLAALISGLKSARLAGGDLRIAQAASQARVVLELTRLDRVLRCYATVEEALAGYKEQT
jgi:anti-sigma B factor antagonist